MRNICLFVFLLLMVKTDAQMVHSDKIGNPLLQNFQTPPNAAKPRVWWHWMNGNITKNGIQKDLDWMKQVGIGGFQNFDANLFTPVVVPKKLVFMDVDWKAAFKFTTELAAKNGLEMAIAGSPGWSVTGGLWVEPKDGMKKYVWTETRVKGGETFNGKLLQPPDVVGKFQNVVITDGGISGGFVGKKPNFYQDAYVIAYKVLDSEKTLADLNPKLSSSGGDFDFTKLTDDNLTNATMLPPMKVDEDMWIQYAFETAQTFKALTVSGALTGALDEFNGGVENRSLKVSDDGVTFREIARVPGSTVPHNTVSFASTTAKYWRLCYKTLAPAFNPMLAMMGMPPKKDPDGVNVAEFVLHNTDRIDQFEDKAGFTPWKETATTYIKANSDALDTEGVVDLTSKMSTDGTLNWVCNT